MAEMTWLPRPPGAQLARLLAAWAVLGSLSASPVEARPCLGFSGQGFLGASGAVRREWSENTTGLGGAGGLRAGRVAAAGHVLDYPGVDEDDPESGFESAQVSLAYELRTSPLSLCPVLTSGLEAVSSRDFSYSPYQTASFFGGGLAVGYAFTATDSAVTIVPWLSASIESHLVERLFEGDILLDDRETTVVLRGGVTAELGRLFVRPYATLLAVENGWLTGGATVGVRF